MMVKICGLRDEQALQAALDAGADAVGLVFAESRRRVSLAVAERLLAHVPKGVLRVGVFARQSPDDVAKHTNVLPLDVLQFAGGETAAQALCTAGGRCVWLAGKDVPEPVPEGVDAFLVDAAGTSGYGGTGRLADWQAAREGARRTRVILAGGLTPENVQEAIASVRPYGVDVSSGVEREGVKDVKRIAAFVAAARRAADVVSR